MTQRVNIQYSVELEELQEEVNRLFDKTTTELVSGGDCWGTCKFVPMDVAGIEMIDGIRQQLTRLDIMFGDIQNIVRGYVRFKAAPVEEPQTPAIPEAPQEIENLEDRIARFKELIDEKSDQELEKPDE